MICLKLYSHFFPKKKKRLVNESQTFHFSILCQSCGTDDIKPVSWVSLYFHIFTCQFFFLMMRKLEVARLSHWHGAVSLTGCCGNLKAVLLLIPRICDSLVTVNQNIWTVRRLPRPTLSRMLREVLLVAVALSSLAIERVQHTGQLYPWPVWSTRLVRHTVGILDQPCSSARRALRQCSFISWGLWRHCYWRQNMPQTERSDCAIQKKVIVHSSLVQLSCSQLQNCNLPVQVNVSGIKDPQPHDYFATKTL